jgi:hypothetical protein
MRRGGGVALLLKKSLQFLVNNYPIQSSLEIISASVFTQSGEIECFSVFCPNSNCSQEEIDLLISRPNPFILAGDFNAHHQLWKSSPTVNIAGRSIYNAIIDHPDASLITPLNLGTRIDPSSGKPSTIDLFITSSQFVLNSNISLGPFCGSDDLPIFTTPNADPIRLSSKPPSWIFLKVKWPKWNADLKNCLTSSSFHELSDPKLLYDYFKSSNLTASHMNFSFCPNPPRSLLGNPVVHGGQSTVKTPSHQLKESKRPGVNLFVIRKEIRLKES